MRLALGKGEESQLLVFFECILTPACFKGKTKSDLFCVAYFHSVNAFLWTIVEYLASTSDIFEAYACMGSPFGC